MLSDFEALELARLNEANQAKGHPITAQARSLKGVDSSNWRDALAKLSKAHLSTTGLDAQFLKLHKRVIRGLGLVLLISLIVGALAAGQAFDGQGSQTVNFFWLLTVLLGFNLLTLVFWLVSLGYRLLLQKTQNKHWLTDLIRSASNKTGNSDLMSQWLLLKAHGSLGYWRFSAISHALWFAYLLGGLVAILALLSTRQYDFIWETTLLSPERFLTLTQWLSYSVSPLGIQPPSEVAILASQTGITHEYSAEHREAWAWLLLGSLVMLGLLPRLMLLLVCHWVSNRRERARDPDFSLSYYVALRQCLVPAIQHKGVIDPDTTKAAIPSTEPAAAKTPLPASPSLPDNANWLGLEMPENLEWLPKDLPAERYLGNIIDRESRNCARERLGSNSSSPLLIIADIRRAADRGLQGQLKQLLDQHQGDYRLLLWQPTGIAGQENAITDRLADWYRLAYGIGICDECIIALAAPGEPAKP